MADIFTNTLTDFMSRCPGVEGVAFTDFDGEEIALQPQARREELRMYAVYSGIAFRRLTDVEHKFGRGVLNNVVVKGSERALISMKVSDAYQLVISLDGRVPPAQAIDSARSAVKIIEDNI